MRGKLMFAKAVSITAKLTIKQFASHLLHRLLSLSLSVTIGVHAKMTLFQAVCYSVRGMRKLRLWVHIVLIDVIHDLFGFVLRKLFALTCCVLNVAPFHDLLAALRNVFSAEYFLQIARIRNISASGICKHLVDQQDIIDRYFAISVLQYGTLTGDHFKL